MEPIKDRLYLKKVINSYVLHRVKDGILTIEGDSEFVVGGIEPFYKLSKYNCDKIFGVADFEMLACDEIGIDVGTYKHIHAKATEKLASPCVPLNEGGCVGSNLYSQVNGFIKAMELNKDKKFTEVDMIKFADAVYKLRKENQVFEGMPELLQSLQQPIEIDVTIEHYNFELPGKPIGGRVFKPKLDSEGCIILTKKI
jgi:hypothetical protein